MWKYLLAVLFVVVVRPGLGQDMTHVGSPAISGAQREGTAITPNDHASPKILTVRADQLLDDANRMEAVGLREEAQQDRLAAAKELAHPTTGPAQQIVVNLRILEFSRIALSKLVAQRYGGSKDTSVLEFLSKLQSLGPATGNSAPPASSDPRLLSLLDALRKDHFMRVLAEPVLAVDPEMSAYCRVGRELSSLLKEEYGQLAKESQGREVLYPLEYGSDMNERQRLSGTIVGEYGTRVDILPHLVSKERMHLDVRLRVTELDYANRALLISNCPEVETSVEVCSGEAIAIYGAGKRMFTTVSSPPTVASDPPAEIRNFDDVQTIVLLTPKIVTKTIPKTTTAKPAARR